MASKALAKLLASSALIASATAQANLSPAKHAEYDRIQYAHGIMAALTWAIFFPVGAVLLRTLPGRYALWAHSIWQTFTYGVFTAAVGMGIWMAVSADKLVDYHPVIGLIVFGLASLQPLGGWLAHVFYKKRQRPTGVGTGHAYTGIFLITLGMINGGLGIMYGGNAIKREECIAYAVIVACIWIVFMAFTIMGRSRRTKSMREKRMSEATATTA